MSKPMSEQMQKLAARYEKATGKKFGARTNADRIRAMSDEELGEWYCKNRHCGDCDFHTASGCDCMKWLQNPAEEDDHA